MKYFYTISGSIFFGIGVLGIFVPLFPTTLFLLLAAGCYAKGSPKRYRWLIGNKILGKYIHDFRKNRAIPLFAKILSMLLLWLSMGYCILFVVDALWLRLILFAIAAIVTFHVLSFKTLKK